VRPRLIEGRLAHARQDWAKAATAFERAVENDIEYLPIALGPMLDALEQLDRRESIDAMLEESMRRYPGISPVIKMARRIRERSGDAEAVQFLSERLRKKPSVRGLAELVELQLATLQGDAREQMERLRDLLHPLIEGQALFRCSRCGFGARAHHWQCPGCKSWSTIKPVHGIAGN
jgi:lipopolysaccharide assembly protein B